MKEALRAREISPKESQTGRSSFFCGARVGSTAHSAAHRSGWAAPRSNTPLAPKLKPVR